MDQDIFLVILTIIGVIVGAILDHYGFSRYKNAANLFLNALKDGRLTKEEMSEVFAALSEAVKDDDSKTV